MFEPFGKLSPKQFVDRHLWDAATLVCVSERLRKTLSPHRKILHVPQGLDTAPLRRRKRGSDRSSSDGSGEPARSRKAWRRS